VTLKMSSMSSQEFWELLKSTLIVAVVFTIAYKPGTDPAYVALVISLLALAAGAGFFLHELMHKLVAQRYGYDAQYHAGEMSYVSILFAFAGWILLAPGAVMISSPTRPLSKDAGGVISLAGPATNLALALSFYALSKASTAPIVHALGALGYDINIWLALFNMLPAPGFDGQGVFRWSKAAYGGFAAAALAAFFLLKA
jgi:Zn-dependent protease